MSDELKFLDYIVVDENGNQLAAWPINPITLEPILEAGQQKIPLKKENHATKTIL